VHRALSMNSRALLPSLCFFPTPRTSLRARSSPTPHYFGLLRLAESALAVPFFSQTSDGALSLPTRPHTHDGTFEGFLFCFHFLFALQRPLPCMSRTLSSASTETLPETPVSAGFCETSPTTSFSPSLFPLLFSSITRFLFPCLGHEISWSRVLRVASFFNPSGLKLPS